MAAILTQWTPRRMLGVWQGKGRPEGRTAGSWVADLVALGKCVSLCVATCDRKFNAARNGYTSHAQIPLARGTCDGCHQYSPQNRLYVKQTAYH